MATALNPISGTESFGRKRFTRREFDRLMETDVFAGARYELIDGDLIDKMGQNPPHAFGVFALVNWLTQLFGREKIRCRLPIEVGESDRLTSFPEPDLAVLRGSGYQYRGRHPQGSELALIIEVADSSVGFDRTVKSGLYARAGVPEYWVLDVAARALFVHRGLRDERYTRIEEVSELDSITPESIVSDQGIRVGELLP